MRKAPVCLYSLLIMTCLGFILAACQKLDFEREIAVEAYDVDILSAYSINLLGELIDDGGGLSNFGIVVSASSSTPAITSSDAIIVNLAGETGAFTAFIDGLQPLTEYHASVFATKNGTDYTYSNALRFIIQNVWVQKNNFMGSPRTGAVGFTLDGKGYMGMGENWDEGDLFDLWQYDPESDTWTQKAEFPSWTSVTSFSAGTANLGLGFVLLARSNELWTYLVADNTWERKADFPGAGRNSGFGFAYGNTIFLGGGVITDPDIIYPVDFWEYDYIEDVWTRKADFPGEGREKAVNFRIGTKGYMGLGYVDEDDVIRAKFDFWEFDPEDASNGSDARGNALGAWIRKTDGPAATGFAGFPIANMGFMFADDRFYIYDPLRNSWSASPAFSGMSRSNAAGFTLNNRAFVGTGDVGHPEENATYLNDFWEYIPELY